MPEKEKNAPFTSFVRPHNLLTAGRPQYRKEGAFFCALNKYGMSRNYKNSGFVTGYSRACGCQRPPEGGEETPAQTPAGESRPCAAALAMAYVPRQEFGGLYPPEKAWQRGTLFAALDLPYSIGGTNG